MKVPRFRNWMQALTFLNDLPEDDKAVIEEEFDEIVHEIKSSEAADINNGGFSSQVEFIATSCGDAGLSDLQAVIDEACEGGEDGN